MRRKDREVLGLENQLAILDKCDVVRIGLCDGDMPYVVPMNFGYQVVEGDLYIYMHCAHEGRKLGIISKNNNVCFEADCSVAILEGAEPCDWSAEYESVIGTGKIHIIQDEADKAAALAILMRHHGFEREVVFPQGNLASVAVLEIEVDSLSAKRHKAF
ncbi:MAG: pyridoxamine 5'-phosphate oxidase family protein [Eubacteriaceae bacterium]|nr:pyridoxamine 5'-phosphate oxidase family protein [Eubacteriaceae bacterium]